MAPITLLLLAARLLVSSGDYTAELTRYTESVILQLALSQPGTFECVLFDMHKQHPFEVVLGDLMRSPKLGHVVKYAVSGSFAGETFHYPEDPSLVVIHAGRSYQFARDVPRKGTVVNSSDKLVSMDGVSAYLATRSKARLYLPIFYFDYNLQRNSYVILDDHLGMLIGAFLTSNHNPLQEILEWSERAFFEGGLLNLYTAHFQLESVHAMQKFRPRTAAKVMLTIDDLLPAWLSLAVGTVASGVLFCGELLIGRSVNNTMSLIYLKDPETHVILVPRGKTLNVFELFKAPFTTEAWIVLLLIIISLEVLSFILPAQFKNDPALLLICGLERYDLHKANRWEKMILFAFIVFFFLMTNAYETKIISMMASKPTHRSIRTFEELVKAGIPTKANFNHVIKLDLGLLNETLQNATEDLSSMDGVSAYLATRTKSEIFLPIQYFDDSLQRTSYVIMAETLGLLIGALQTSDRNPLQDVLEASHATFVEGGLLGHYTERMKMQYFYARRKTQPQTEKTLLAIDDLSPAWIALGVGGRTLTVFELFVAPFTPEAWAALLVIIISLELVSFTMPSFFRNDPALLLICGLERYDLHKANRWEKMILLAFIIFFFLVTNAYETKIISMMTSKPTLGTVKTIEELVASGMPTKVPFKNLGTWDMSIFKDTLTNSSDTLFEMDHTSAYLATRIKSEMYIPIFYSDDHSHQGSYAILEETLELLIGAMATSDHNPLQEFLVWSESAFFEAGFFDYFREYNAGGSAASSDGSGKAAAGGNSAAAGDRPQYNKRGAPEIQTIVGTPQHGYINQPVVAGGAAATGTPSIAALGPVAAVAYATYAHPQHQQQLVQASSISSPQVCTGYLM
ncbi:hypothetical protein quinque_000779 [Culex quinquefasciatus]